MKVGQRQPYSNRCVCCHRFFMWLKCTHRVAGSIATKYNLHFAELQSEGLALLYELPLNQPLYEHPIHHPIVWVQLVKNSNTALPREQGEVKGV
jgi:hypothetical protein